MSDERELEALAQWVDPPGGAPALAVWLRAQSAEVWALVCDFLQDPSDSRGLRAAVTVLEADSQLPLSGLLDRFEADAMDVLDGRKAFRREIQKMRRQDQAEGWAFAYGVHRAAGMSGWSNWRTGDPGDALRALAIDQSKSAEYIRKEIARAAQRKARDAGKAFGRKMVEHWSEAAFIAYRDQALTPRRR